MIKLRHQQPSLWHRGLAEDIEGLWEPWMLLVDKLLEDEQVLDTVYEAPGERHPQSRPAWANANPGGSSVAPAVVEAHAELELRRAGARGAGQSGVSRLSPDRG